MATFLMYPHTMEATNPMRLGPALMASLSHSYLLKASSPNEVTFGFRRRLQHTNSLGTQFIHCIDYYTFLWRKFKYPFTVKLKKSCISPLAFSWSKVFGLRWDMISEVVGATHRSPQSSSFLRANSATQRNNPLSGTLKQRTTNTSLTLQAHDL